MQILHVMIILLLLPQDSAAQHPSTYLDVLQVQVMLDRARFSPGVIDGYMGANTEKALAMFQKQGRQAQPATPTTRYRITSEDVTGPFKTIPSDIMKMASLSALGYTSLLEEIAERFHTTPKLLKKLNSKARFAEGEEINVPNVEPMVMPKQKNEAAKAATTGKTAPAKPEVIVTVTKSMSALTVTDTSGRVLFYAPVTTGSKHDPLPMGEWKVTGVQYNPIFHYNPRLFWDADPKNTKAVIQAGPNNPVGLVWIDISREHYGLHGTPEPSTIGLTQSHGCVRLTNWDALRLAGLVKFGTRVLFNE